MQAGAQTGGCRGRGNLNLVFKRGQDKRREGQEKLKKKIS